MAQTPNVIELYEAAVQHMLPTMEVIKAEQLAEATPCSEWSVQALINHNIKTTGFVQGIIRGNNTVDTGDVGGPLPQEGAGEAFSAGAKEVVALLHSISDLNEVIETPFGPMPIANFVMFPTMDIVVHKWDLAKGTGQNLDMDAGLAEVGVSVLDMGGELGRQFGLFAPEVNVPLSASIHDKLLAMSGRQP